VLILLGSDLQVGKPYRPPVAEAFLVLARALGPDLIVVSGDLTQRAKAAEFRVARAFLDALPEGVPVVVTPGNHDVPLYRFWERLIDPYRNWRRFISPELDTVLRMEGATVVALNSSAPRRAIVAGRIDARQLAFARTAFAATPPDAARIVVVHHHFVPTPDARGGSPLPHARRILEALEEMHVDLVFGGHVHQTHFSTSRALVPGDGPGIPLVACGTTASSRGRGAEAGHNTLAVVRVERDLVEVVPHRLDLDSTRFLPQKAQTFARRGHGVAHADGGER
jgi:3',5'-cyclic AMP phosphodiesterase CpdA